ncbi:glycerophosphodiester phosphodiesterase family protein [uncultured Pseudokineococcus sp.]|uniref:glycerophosphodiester phosphodiesterase family protein n=1 Tax=uncultured Pseudokineococcus sp. TaxID=1642928 RepID=UPI0026125E44|nr:glycerophosphodiester phosphodiesterase family protein [uncultured Pseudokineococcus sp.]
MSWNRLVVSAATVVALAGASTPALQRVAVDAAVDETRPAVGTATGRGEGRDVPLVLAHRGASGYAPEHTGAAYEMAISMGADYIEPDLVLSQDGVFFVRHENEISGTTDVADRPEFADRRTTKTVDGVELTGWFTEDFTAAELRTLRARERLPELRPENTAYDGVEPVPTLAEVVELAQAAGVGVIPEMKHPTYFASIGLPMPQRLVDELASYGLDDEDDPVVVQSFDVTPLQEVDAVSDVRTSLNLAGPTSVPPDYAAQGRRTTYGDLTGSGQLRRLSRFVDVIGAEKGYVIPREADGSLGEPTDLVARAHRAGLEVAVYTLRRENAFLPTDLRGGDPASPLYARATGESAKEHRAFYEAGVDAVFSDNPDVAVAARHETFADSDPDDPRP